MGEGGGSAHGAVQVATAEVTLPTAAAAETFTAHMLANATDVVGESPLLTMLRLVAARVESPKGTVQEAALTDAVSGSEPQQSEAEAPTDVSVAAAGGVRVEIVYGASAAGGLSLLVALGMVALVVRRSRQSSGAHHAPTIRAAWYSLQPMS